MKIGILGGTFDPIHRGHLALARHALKQFKLDRILFIPSARPPHKKNVRSVTSAKHRLAMVRLAVGQSTRFEISELEIKRKGPSYTIDTLETLRKKFPTAKLFLILGQDAYEDLRYWKNPTAIRRLVHFLVAKRAGSHALKKAGENTSWIRMPFFPVSSSEIREAVKYKRRLGDYLPQKVIHYIRGHCLYRRRS